MTSRSEQAEARILVEQVAQCSHQDPQPCRCYCVKADGILVALGPKPSCDQFRGQLVELLLALGFLGHLIEHFPGHQEEHEPAAKDLN